MPSFSSFNIANEQSCQQTRFVVTWQEELYFGQEQENDVLVPQPCFPHYCKMYENHSDSLLSQVSEWSELYFQNYMLPKIKNWKWDFFGHFQTVCIVLNLPWQKKKSFDLSTISLCFKITEKVSFNIASEASYVYNLSGQKFIKNEKNVNLASFWKPEACGQTVLPDRSVLKGKNCWKCQN